MFRWLIQAGADIEYRRESAIFRPKRPAMLSSRAEFGQERTLTIASLDTTLDNSPLIRAMNSIKLVTAVLVLSLFLAGLLAFFLWIRTPLAIDRCLDQGGRWDYAKESCEGGERVAKAMLKIRFGSIPVLR